MFLQVSVCPQGACMAGGMHGRGVCMAGGSVHVRGHAWQGCVCGRGCAWQGGMCGQGLCMGGMHGKHADTPADTCYVINLD